MKLQINTKGSWRDIVEFEPESLDRIQEAVIPLARAIESRGIWRISLNGRTALSYLIPPAFEWRKE